MDERPILVAQDGSPAAAAAASVAIQVAQSLDLAMQGLYIVDETVVMDPYADFQPEMGDSKPPTSSAGLVTQFEEQGTAALEWLDARCRLANVPLTVRMEIGGVTELVLEQAAKAQLLALGRRGNRHANDREHLGRHFRTIAHQVQVPMLIGGDGERRVQRLLLAYNGRPHARDALHWAALLQQALPIRVIALAVKEDDNAIQAQQWLADVEDGLNACGLAGCRRLIRQGQPAEEIIAAAAESAVDMIVMGGYRHKALLEWLTSSTVDRVLRSTSLPVLVA